MDNFFLENPSIDRFLSKSEDEIKIASLEIQAGTRVCPIRSLESILTYDNLPEQNVLGTVIKVRTAAGDSTQVGGRVFIKWDNGEFGSYLPEHIQILNIKIAACYRKKVSSLMDLTDFFKQGSDLVHKATKDLWALKKEGDEIVIERLFDDSGDPLKV